MLAQVVSSNELTPCIWTGIEAGYPDLAYIYNWAVRFKVLVKNNTDCSSISGQVVQKVECRKKVFNHNGSLDTDQSMSETLWESFKIVNGVTERTDMIQLVFHKHRYTITELVLSASYHPKIVGATVIPLHPKGTSNGAEGKILRQPTYFTPTLIRKVAISVNNTHEASEFHWLASKQNQLETYETKWVQKAIDQEVVIHQGHNINLREVEP